MTTLLVRSLTLIVAGELLATTAQAQNAARSTTPSSKTLQTRVWVNRNTKVYHCPGAKEYGTTKNGEFMEEAQARGHGNRAAGRNACNNVVTKGAAPLPDTTRAAKRMVWVNTESGVYHCPSSSDWGMTRRGRYLNEVDASAAGHKPAAGRKCEGP